MSAWIVEKPHIDYIVTASIAAELTAPSKANETGQMLWAENLKSVAYRYPNDRSGTRPGPIGFQDRDVKRYTWTETPILTAGALAKTLGCYHYQSCEHPGYETSEAAKLIEKLQEPLEGVDYDNDTPWGWSR